ncbi:fimbrillin family protein [Bacteroides caecigallinarum]|uniref:fimbrillin family protein n=1 Tax=Bacteroides caecigallinarum TaxID=1411144 RepID=UPI001F2D7883|nr:fimbrillin family protein [Bacteroides caecigallinarum]MCF2593340.1 fimbrillin family protein [Bacteroides caecigallinarum]
MKRNLLFCGVAALAFASCTQNEVLNVNENRAIGFDAFVGKATKAGEVVQASFSKFAVYGSYTTDNSNWTPVYQNVTVNGTNNSNWTPEKQAYWQSGADYSFCAYSNGNDVLADNKVTFDAATTKLSFTNYEAGENDLVVASNSTIRSVNPSSQGEVQLSFKHMLSKVKFTFKTDASDNYTMKVNSLKISNAIKTGSCDYTNGTIGDWTGSADGEYIYTVTGLTDFAATSGAPFETVMYLIPQANASLEATISVNVTDGGALDKTKTFNVPLKYTPATVDGKGTADKWTEGYVYNYIATINPDDVTDEVNEITFTTEVGTWTESNDQNWPAN